MRVIASHSISSGGKIGSSGKHCVTWIYDVEDENRRLFQGKTSGRELLVDKQRIVDKKTAHGASPPRLPELLKVRAGPDGERPAPGARRATPSGKARWPARV